MYRYCGDGPGRDLPRCGCRFLRQAVPPPSAAAPDKSLQRGPPMAARGGPGAWRRLSDGRPRARDLPKTIMAPFWRQIRTGDVAGPRENWFLHCFVYYLFKDYSFHYFSKRIYLWQMVQVWKIIFEYVNKSTKLKFSYFTNNEIINRSFIKFKNN